MENTNSWSPAIAQEPESLRAILLKAADLVGMSLKLSDAGQIISNKETKQTVEEGKIGVTLFQKNAESAAEFWKKVSELEAQDKKR